LPQDQTTGLKARLQAALLAQRSGQA